MRNLDINMNQTKLIKTSILIQPFF